MSTPSTSLSRTGAQRFPQGAEFAKLLNTRANFAVQRMIANLPSNYPDTELSSIASLFRAFSEERERMLKSLYDIMDDQFDGDTRPEYLFQILGDLLFLNAKSAGDQFTDTSYRDFLIKVRNAYLVGSRKDNIQASLSEILGFPVILRELYLETRKSNSPATVKDSNKMVADIFMNAATNAEQLQLSTVLQDLYFFIALIKPAHVIFDTQLIFEDTIGTTSCGYQGFAVDANGNTFEYEYSPLDHSIYSLLKLSVFAGDPTESEVITIDWVAGTITNIDYALGVITLSDGTELVLNRFSLCYDRDAQGDFRIDLDSVLVGSTIWFYGYLAPGEFVFQHPVAAVVANWYKQFDPLVIQSPDFQGNVSKLLNGDSSFQNMIRGCDHNLSSVDVDFALLSEYEDMRDNCDYPSPVPYSAIFYGPSVTPGDSGDGYQDLRAHLTATEDPNTFILSPAPIVDSYGNFASASTPLVFVDGALVSDAVLSLDPLSGEISLNFLLPASSVLRIDFYYQSIYPAVTTQEFIRYPAIASAMPDMGARVSVAPEGAGYSIPFFQWPFVPAQEELYGNDGSYQLSVYPILGQLGDLAEVSDVLVYVNGIEIFNAVSFIRPLLGQVQLNFIAPVGTPVSFKYYSQKKNRSYAMLSDSVQHLTDTTYGPEFSYSLISDPAPYTGPLGQYDRYRTPAVYGYRYRAFDLGSSSVWNSPDTFKLNDFTVPAKVWSHTGPHSKFSAYKVKFSPEYLYDTNKSVELNDDYLSNHLPALIQLRKGVPPFYRSFTSPGNFRYQQLISPTASSYNASLEGAMDLAADAVADNIPSGLVEYVPLPDFIERDRIKVLSGLYEHADVLSGDETVSLTSICEDRGMSLEVGLEEEYFPNRELRLNDYKDYAERLVTDLSSGTLFAIKGSDVVKGEGVTWRGVRLGTILRVGDQSYTVLRVYNENTLRVHPKFGNASGKYAYEMDFEYVTNVRVALNTVTRKLSLDLSGLMPYYATGFSGSYAPWLIETSFPDPDPDPYPRNAYGTPGAPPLLTSQIGDENGELGLLETPEEAEKLVKFRNWDQEMIVLTPELMLESFAEPMDDTVSDGVRMLFWNVSMQDFVEYSFSGLVIITSVSSGVANASQYPKGLIRLANRNDVSGLNDTQYQVLSSVVRQIMPDNTVNILALDELVRL